MAKEDKRLLIRQATKPTTLSLTVEGARGKLKSLVERGVPYDAPEMLSTLQRFERADTEWKRLEAEHLALRKKLGIK